jgi:hypothetical protein
MRPPVPEIPLETIVYLKANADYKGMVTGYIVRPQGGIIYLVTWGSDGLEQQHWECELTDTKSFDTNGGDE